MSPGVRRCILLSCVGGDLGVGVAAARKNELVSMSIERPRREQVCQSIIMFMGDKTFEWHVEAPSSPLNWRDAQYWRLMECSFGTRQLHAPRAR